jgi:hypothetical protein
MRIFGPVTEEVTGEWRKLCNKERHNFYSSPYIDSGVKSRRVRWVVHIVHIAHMGEVRFTCTVLAM